VRFGSLWSIDKIISLNFNVPAYTKGVKLIFVIVAENLAL